MPDRSIGLGILVLAVSFLIGGASPPAQAKDVNKPDYSKTNSVAVQRYLKLMNTHADNAYEINGNQLYDNPRVQNYVNQLGQSLVPDDIDPEVRVVIRVIHDPKPNAFALSTGSIYVTSGLISMVENEAQLAYILAHEIAHVARFHEWYKIRYQASAEAGAQMLGIVLAVATAGIAASNDADPGLAASAALGAYALGAGTGTLFLDHSTKQYSERLEDEADEYALEYMMARNQDARESLATYDRLKNSVASDARVGLAFWAHPDRVEDRVKKLERLLKKEHNKEIKKAVEAGLLKISSPDFALQMATLKRDNAFIAMQFDLNHMALNNLVESEKIRSDDPWVQYLLGLVYMRSGRTKEERSKSEQYFQRAISLSEKQGVFPYPYRDYAVLLMEKNDPELYPQIREALVNYVEAYRRRSGGQLPSDIYAVYDYMRLIGNPDWSVVPIAYVKTDESPPEK